LNELKSKLKLKENEEKKVIIADYFSHNPNEVELKT